MLTEEQIKNLKPGDIIDIRGFVDIPLSNGNILVELRYEFDHRTLSSYKQISTEFISLPGEPEEKPKYDPTRLFRKGDKVRVVAWNGRDIARVGQVGYVVANEYNSKVELEIDGWKKDVFYPVCHLELISPVEELEPCRDCKSINP